MRQFGPGRAYLLNAQMAFRAFLGFFLLVASFSIVEGNATSMAFAIVGLITNVKILFLAYTFQFSTYTYFCVASCWCCSCCACFATEECRRMVKIPKTDMWFCPCCCIPCDDKKCCPKISLFRIFAFYWKGPGYLETLKFVCSCNKERGCHEGYEAVEQQQQLRGATALTGGSATWQESAPVFRHHSSCQ